MQLRKELFDLLNIRGNKVMLYKESLIKRILLKFKYGSKSSSESYIKYLRKKGLSIGENVEFNSPWTTTVDYFKPWLVEIGNNVIVSSNVSILTHGADWRILQNLYGDVIGSGNTVKIGNNVFIGTKTTILKNVTIGDNVIIGAGSVVTKDLKSNAVYAGSPAKFIMHIEDYYEKRKKLQLDELNNNVKYYYKKYGRYPKEEEMKGYFWIFKNRNEKLNEIFKMMNHNCCNPELSDRKYQETEPLYNSYEEFLKEVKIDEY